MKYILPFILCGLLFSALKAEQFEVDIKYLGIPAVRVKIVHTDSTISIKAKSSKFASIASKMDNSYDVEYRDLHLPYTYRKEIDQRDYQEDRLTTYHRSRREAERYNFADSTTYSYKINPFSRDFFSSLFYLRDNLDEEDKQIFLDANGIIWTATFSKLGEEKIRTFMGKVNTHKYLIQCKKLSEAEQPESDMLTNNLVDEDVSLVFWFTADERKLPVKAKFMMKPFAVVWKLKDYSYK
jgi:hypothetical protein